MKCCGQYPPVPAVALPLHSTYSHFTFAVTHERPLDWSAGNNRRISQSSIDLRCSCSSRRRSGVLMLTTRDDRADDASPSLSAITCLPHKGMNWYVIRDNAMRQRGLHLNNTDAISSWCCYQTAKPVVGILDKNKSTVTTVATYMTYDVRVASTKRLYEHLNSTYMT